MELAAVKRVQYRLGNGNFELACAWPDSVDGHGRRREWKHGLGPCGETVSALRAGVDDRWLVIEQFTEVSHKLFRIPLRDIDGPITFEY